MQIEPETLHRQYSFIDEQGFREMIEICAYFKFANRGFTGGHELQDWLEAEAEVTKRCFYWFNEV